ncbi:hypothetical protein [Clostridium polynesiense]|uniref:hypothetical protein n=1 Tax=Clostridium polynesiense TaxID=1325933 RepID=UPI00058FDF60|nr:hypothetical protein [Clostridium polynesiense]
MKKESKENFASSWNSVRRFGKPLYIKKQGFIFSIKIFSCLMIFFILIYRHLNLNMELLNFILLLALCCQGSGMYLANLAWEENEKKYKQILEYYDLL